MKPVDPFLVYEDEQFLLEHSKGPLVPGYLFLHLKKGFLSLGDLDADTASRLGPMLTRATKAIEAVVKPERVYALVFAEVKREVHFHLFPRTKPLLEAYFDATGRGGEPVDGPKLIQWVREGANPEASAAEVAAVCQRLRAEL